MIRIKDTRHQNTGALLGNAVETAEYYGFRALDDMRLEKKMMPSAAQLERTLSLARREERSLLPVVRRCLASAGDMHDPKLLWRIARSVSRSGGACATLELHVLGVPSAIAEALLIVIVDAIAQDAGLSHRTLALNSIGTTESSTRYVRDVGLFLRKHIDSIAPALRPRTSDDPLGTLIQLIEKGHPATARAPQATEYLTEEERRRFWELLEHLESFGLAYELNPHILGSRDFWSHTLFELSVTDEETGAKVPVAWGGRYDPLARAFFGAQAPGATATIMCEVRGKASTKRGKVPQPSLFFAHLGAEARRKSLAVLETLRRARIPVLQSIMHERLGDQMAIATRLRVPYVLIMGHKEFVEGTILVREVATNAQRAVPLPELPNTLRRYRLTV